jgi:RNA polymerase sigma-70 factor (ECF subfamily)
LNPGLTISLSGRRRQRAAEERISGLFEEHGRMVYGVCRLILRDPTEAEDAAQQTFLSAYRALLAGQEPRDPPAWLGTIARNECRGRLRSRANEPLTLVEAASGHDTQREAGRRAEIEALCAALAELPPQQRDAVVLREFYGLSYREVAAALGVSGAAVESILFRSRKRLQAQLRPLRAALGALTLPPTLQESLAQALPGFGGGAGAAAVAKVGGASLLAKVAAATLALGTAGTVAGLEVHSGPPAPRHAHRAARPAQRTPGQVVAPVRAAATFRGSTTTTEREQRDRESNRREQSGGQTTAREHRSTETRRSGPEHEHESTPTTTQPEPSGDSGHDGGGTTTTVVSGDSGHDGGGDHTTTTTGTTTTGDSGGGGGHDGRD